MADPAYFKLFLKIIAVLFFFVGALHLTLGLQADQLLGAQVSLQTLSDPGLQSQNRFFGVSLTFYGAVFWLAANDLARHALVLRLAITFIFVAALARFVAVALFGWPPLLVGVLFGAEIVLPPVALIWLRALPKAALDH